MKKKFSRYINPNPDFARLRQVKFWLVSCLIIFSAVKIIFAQEDIGKGNDLLTSDYKKQQNILLDNLKNYGYSASAQAINRELGSREYFIDFYKQGKNYFKRGQYSQAFSEFKKVLDINPQFEPAKEYIQLIKEEISLQQELKTEQKLASLRKKAIVWKKNKLDKEKKEKKENEKNLKAKEQLEKEFARKIKREEEARQKKQANFKKLNEDNIKNALDEKTQIRKGEEEQERLAKEQTETAVAKGIRCKEIELKEQAEFWKLNEDKIKNGLNKNSGLKQAETGEHKITAYQLDIEDVLQIDVWRHPELSKEAIVRPDGMISYPLIGDVKAAGLTLPQLKESLTKSLSEFSRRKFTPQEREKFGQEAVYLIGLGDTLDISVWKAQDLSRETIVRPDGMISFPLVNDIKAAGLNLVQLDEEITNSLSNYIKEPQVSVMVKSFGWKKELPAEVFLEENLDVSVMLKKFGGKKVIVLGEVAKPGVYTFTRDILLTEAIGLAGDCTKYAVKKNIMVIRGDIHNNPQIIKSNLLAILKEAKLTENVFIHPQDIVFVPRTLIGNVNTFLESIAPLLDTAYKGSVVQTIITGD